MRFERKVKCKMCGKKSARDWVYKFWHHVTCYEYLGSEHGTIDVTWVKTWWICNGCRPEPQHSWRDRFHDIDGFTYKIRPFPPFLIRS